MAQREILAFVPILNAGVKHQPEYEFCSGVKICVSKVPEILRNAIAELKFNNHVSPMEISTEHIAAGCMWLSAPARSTNSRDIIKQTTELAVEIQNVLWCIYLNPFGENAYWRSSNLINCCGVYVNTGKMGFDDPRRFPFMYGIPSGEQGMLTGWSKEHLDAANELLAAVRSCRRAIPRLYLAGKVQRLMASIEVMKFSAVRLQLAVTALETFFIAPGERIYIWDKEPIRRIKQFCKEKVKIPESYFDDLRVVRNNAVHRSGLRNPAESKRKGGSVLVTTELILRESLKRGILDQSLLADAFDEDRWPEL